jgi:pSer/pThr/pTyr-binding forkhead associated (FHA) protein
MATMEMIAGSRAGAQYELDAQTLIGRHSACDLFLAEGAVSRWHCRIIRDTEGYYVEDLGSLNGTFVNGDRIRGRRQLDDGDEIQLYGVRMRFRAADSAVGRGAGSYAMSDSSAA